MKRDQGGLLDAYPLDPNLNYNFSCGPCGESLVSWFKLFLGGFLFLVGECVWEYGEQSHNLNMWISVILYKIPLVKLCDVVPCSNKKHLRIMGHFQNILISLYEWLKGDGESKI